MNKALYSLEMIAHQGLSALAMDLELGIAELQKNKRTGQIDMENAGLSKAIKKHTGLSLKINVVDPGQACVLVPQMSRNHVLLNEYRKAAWGNTEIDRFHAIKDKFVGTIDLKNSKVSGDFCEPFAEIFIGEDFLVKGSNYTPGEVCAIILHEVGHDFMTMAMLYRYSRTNYILEQGTRAMLECDTQEQRILILTQLENLYGETVPDKERVAEGKKNPDYYRTVFLSVAVKESYSQLGFNLYDLRAFEQQADQFATRHGMGRQLAIGLDKYHREYHDRAYWSSPVHYFLCVLEILYYAMMIFGTSGFIFITIASSMYYTNYEIYDPIPKRLEKIKLDTNNALKQKGLKRQEKERLLKDIEIIDGLLANMTEGRSTVIAYIWNHALPWGRKERKEIEFNEQLEQLFNNSLYAAAASITQ